MDNPDSAYVKDILDTIKILEGFLQGVNKESLRNLLIHEYAYIDGEEIWKACESDIPDLKNKLLQINI